MTAPEIAAQRCASSPNPAITCWEDLQAYPTLGKPLPIVMLWIDAATGSVRVTRLLASTAETDLAAGILRPRDYDPQLNARVWFLAG